MFYQKRRNVREIWEFISECVYCTLIIRTVKSLFHEKYSYSIQLK